MRIVTIKTPAALVLFLVQYLSLGYLLISGRPYPGTWYSWPFYLSGLILGIWALITMGWANLNAAPDIQSSGRLVTSGPYRYIRHPMYAAILLVIVPLVAGSPSSIRWILLLVLSVNLLLKLRYEERRLNEYFEGYPEYSSKTWRLLPYVY